MKSTTNLRSNIEERDSPITCRTLISVDDEGDVLPQRCFLPKGSHLQHNWHMNYRSQVETSSPDANRRHGQVRSLLLKESLLVFIPPLGYMLKFSGSADLHEHVHPAPQGWESKAIQRHRSLGRAHRNVTRQPRHSTPVGDPADRANIEREPSQLAPK